ncbi:MAG TPA: hypothetical protein DCQ76_02145 [Ruminococcaceae bacterium]|nr:hypothetical protein [Oscillospiraceae bacterium]
MSILKYKDPKTGEFKRINPYKADLSFVGKDGIVVNKVANSEEVEISGSGCVPIDTRNTGLRRAYTVNETGREQIMMPINVDAYPTNIYSLVRRDGNVSVHGLVPDSPTDTVLLNKKYVADNYVEKVKFTNLEQALNGYILDTTKETYADLDSAVLKNSVAVGDNVYPIADKTRALVTRIEGKTTKMVQLLDKSTYYGTKTNFGITATNNGDGSWTINGTATAEAFINFSSALSLDDGHKVLLAGNKTNSGFSLGLLNQHIEDTGNGAIGNIKADFARTWGISWRSGAVINNVTIYPQLFDLTAMNREDITTIEQFKAEFPDIYPYENGNIYPAKISGVKFYEKQDKSGEQASVTLPETYDLHGIGDYKDYLEITKNEDNELYTLKKIQQIENKVLNGTETVNKSGYVTTNYQSYYIPLALLHVNNGLGGICNKLLTATPDKDIEHITFGINNVYPYLFFDKETYTTKDSVKAYLAAQYAANDPLIIYYIRQKPVETVIATNLTYEQVTAIRHNGGLIEVEDNTNKGYARPTVKNTIVYRLTATSTAEV